MAEVVPGEISDKPLLAVIPFNIDVQTILPIIGELRRSGKRVELELRGRKIGKAMSWANSIGADYTYVVGPRDLEQGSGMLKSLSSGEQQQVALSSEIAASRKVVILLFGFRSALVDECRHSDCCRRNN